MKIKLFTIQPFAVLEEIEKNGKYVCKEELSECLKDDKKFHKAYDWISKQMDKRIGTKPSNVKYPVWAWYIYNGENNLPIFDEDFPLTENRKEFALITLEIEESDVLLSSYEHWHGPLNDSFWHYEEDDDEWDMTNEWYETLTSEEKEKVKIESWNEIFNVKNCDYVQATFWELRKEDIINIIRVTSNN